MLRFFLDGEGLHLLKEQFIAGDNETGISIMQMNEGLDTGDILLTINTLSQI